MFFNQPILLNLRLALILYFLFQFTIYSQNKFSEKDIHSKLQFIDAKLENREYEEVLVKIEEIESSPNYILNDKIRLDLGFKKAKAFYGKNDDEKSISLLLKGLDEVRLINDNTLLMQYCSYLGSVFEKAKNFNKSIYYHRLIIGNDDIKSDTTYILNSYVSIGRAYYFMKEADSAVFYYNKVIEYPVNSRTENIISNAYNNLGLMARENKDFDMAKDYGNKTLNIKQQLNDTLGIAVAYLNLSNILYEKEDYQQAEQQYLEAYKTIEYSNASKSFELKEDILYNLAYTSEELGNYKKAYLYLLDASELTDSLSQVTIDQKITETEAKYNVAKEAQKVEVEKSKRLRAQVFFFGLSFAFLVFIVFGYIFYRNYRLKQRNKLEQIENETQTRIINATIDAKEKERKSIAEILHDSVSALLSSANLHLQATKAQLKKEAPQEISKAQVIVNEASVKIRDLSHELISSVLLKFGLAFAVHDMCQKYSNSEITLHSDDNGIKRYEQDFEIKIHNIVEELINNILKHSDASNATIMLAHRENDMLSIRISDDGKGFNVKTARDKDGLGLSHINARIKVMKGVFNIVSSKGNGTSIFILVPIQHKKVA